MTPAQRAVGQTSCTSAATKATNKPRASMLAATPQIECSVAEHAKRPQPLWTWAALNAQFDAAMGLDHARWQACVCRVAAAARGRERLPARMFQLCGCSGPSVGSASGDAPASVAVIGCPTGEQGSVVIACSFFGTSTSSDISHGSCSRSSRCMRDSEVAFDLSQESDRDILFVLSCWYRRGAKYMI